MYLNVQTLVASIVALAISTTIFADRMNVDVLSDTGNLIGLHYNFPAHRMEEVIIKGQTFQRPVLQGENHMMNTAYPALPDVSRGIIIPDQGNVNFRIVEVTSHEIKGVKIAPSKGTISRALDP